MKIASGTYVFSVSETPTGIVAEYSARRLSIGVATRGTVVTVRSGFRISTTAFAIVTTSRSSVITLKVTVPGPHSCMRCRATGSVPMGLETIVFESRR